MGFFAAAAFAVQAYGAIRSAKEKKKAERANAAFYREQKKLQELATKRELDIFTRESDMFIGSQVSAIARSGVDLGGTALMKLAQEQGAVDREKSAIEMGAATRMKLTDMRAQAADRAADSVNSALNLQLLGIGLQSYSAYKTANNRTSLQNQLEQMRLDSALQSTRMRTLPADNSSGVLGA